MVNLGLRYQYQSGWGEEHNRFGSFDPTLTNSATNTPGAMIYGGQQGRHTIEDGVNEWDPRIGLSWSPRTNWAVRASYGIFDAPSSPNSEIVHCQNALLRQITFRDGRSRTLLWAAEHRSSKRTASAAMCLASISIQWLHGL
jgi:hypothetical protein